MASFVLNNAFLRTAEVEHFVNPIGRAVIERAKELAPKLTGHLADSIDGEWVEAGGKRVFRVAAHDFKGGWQEFGTENMEAQPYLGPAAMQVVGNLH